MRKVFNVQRMITFRGSDGKLIMRYAFTKATRNNINYLCVNFLQDTDANLIQYFKRIENFIGQCTVLNGGEKTFDLYQDPQSKTYYLI